MNSHSTDRMVKSKFVRPARRGVLIFVLGGLFLIIGISGAAQVEPSTPFPDLEQLYAQAHLFDYREGNGAWTPIFRDFNDISMALVPPGCFLMGSTNEELDEIGQLRQDGLSLYINETPQHQICFEQPFWFDETEVTQAQFAALSGEMEREPYSKGADRPVESITWFEALNYCRKRGARLPTEAEWEYAARGPDGLTYPWGNTLSDGDLALSETTRTGAPDVGSAAIDRSWVGAVDLTASVGEWTSSLYWPYPYDAGDGREGITTAGENRVVRGGAYPTNNPARLRSAQRYWGAPFTLNVYLGFRCTRSVDPTERSINNGDEASAMACLAAPSSSTRAQLDAAYQLAALFDYAEGNRSWSPVIEYFDGVAMALVPPGCYTMGVTAEEQRSLQAEFEHYHVTNDDPAHRQCFSEPFWIDLTEVTQAQFMRLTDVSIYDSNFICNRRPMENVSWTDASDFCGIRGARLPTEAEWEYAARGPSNFIYPWGDEFIRQNTIWDGNRPETSWLAEVGSLPSGSAWVGALDMSGNMLEWTSSLDRPYPYDPQDGREDPFGDGRRVLRGGGWYAGSAVQLRTTSRGSEFPSGAYFTGFRCTRSVNTDSP